MGCYTQQQYLACGTEFHFTLSQNAHGHHLCECEWTSTSIVIFSNFLLNKYSLTPAMCKQEEEVREKRAIHVGSHLEMISFLSKTGTKPMEPSVKNVKTQGAQNLAISV